MILARLSAPGADTGLSLRGWLAAVAATIAVAALVGLQNTFRFPQYGFWQTFRFELPVWLSWLAVLPLILRLSRRFPLGSGRTALHLPLHLAAAAGSVLFVVIATEHLRRITGPAEMLVLSRGSIATIPFIFAMLIIVHFTLVAVAHAVDYRRAYNARSFRAAQLEAELARARLEGLRSQLQPHFLFNTLNTISGSVSEDPALARRMIMRLSELLRVTVRASSCNEVPLAAEMEFIRAYAEIQQGRFGPRVDVREEIEADALGCLVPGIILQPLVENAIQHGMPEEPRVLTITIAAHTAGERLIVTVADDGVGPGGGHMSDSGGVGMHNTAARLAALHGSDAGLHVQARPGCPGFAVSLHLPVRRARRPVATNASRQDS